SPVAVQAAPHPMLRVETRSCYTGKISHPTGTFVAVFTKDQAASLDRMQRERERLAKSMNAGDGDVKYIEYSNRFFKKLDAEPALARINRMKGSRAQLAVPTAQRLVVYGYLSDEGELEPQLVRVEV